MQSPVLVVLKRKQRSVAHACMPAGVKAFWFTLPQVTASQSLETLDLLVPSMISSVHLGLQQPKHP